MSVEVEWDNPERTSLRYTVVGHWTWEEFYTARDHARELADEVALTQVNAIIDIRVGSMFPRNSLSHFRDMPDQAHPKLENGTVVVVENSLFVRTLMDIMRRANRIAMENFHRARTLDEARAILHAATEPEPEREPISV